jgi:hypothetical protein
VTDQNEIPRWAKVVGYTIGSILAGALLAVMLAATYATIRGLLS